MDIETMRQVIELGKSMNSSEDDMQYFVYVLEGILDRELVRIEDFYNKLEV